MVVISENLGGQNYIKIKIKNKKLGVKFKFFFFKKKKKSFWKNFGAWGARPLP
jgi:hypothetical protein